MTSDASRRLHSKPLTGVLSVIGILLQLSLKSVNEDLNN